MLITQEQVDAAAAQLELAEARLRQLKEASPDSKAGPEDQRKMVVIEEARAQVALAKANYVRAQEQFQDKVISREEHDAVKAQLAVAEARLKQLRAIAAFPQGAPLRAGNGTDGPLSVLDLAERYLKAITDLKKARSRMDLMKKSDGAHSQWDLNDGEIELERAEYLEKFLTRFIKDAYKSAEAARASANDEYRRSLQLRKEGFLSITDVEAAKARLDEAEAAVKEIQSILDIASPAAGEASQSEKVPTPR
jgi:multidrug resistance efflux pump